MAMHPTGMNPMGMTSMAMHPMGTIRQMAQLKLAVSRGLV